MTEHPATPREEEPPTMGFQRVVCGVDGSPESLEATRQAFGVGDAGATYWTVSVWNPAVTVHADVVDALRERSLTALRTAQEAFPGVEPVLVRGTEVAALLTEIVGINADLVAVGSHGGSRAAGVLFGSVASAMVHSAPCSVLVARRPGSDAFPGLILHANDGSRESLAAALVAGRLAARYGSTVVTLHVGETRDRRVAEEAVAIIDGCGREPVMRVEQGSPHRQLVEFANEAGAGLIVMGSRGRTGLAALGSVSERVTHHASCSVLIVRSALHPVRDKTVS